MSAKGKSTVVYGLADDEDRLSYVGVTNDMRRRLRQHNGVIKGGARYTRKGNKWKILFLVTGLPDRKTALQLEWRLHRRSSGVGPNPFGHSTAARRAWKLYSAFQMERFTTKAPKTSELAPTIYWRETGFFQVATTQPWPAGVRHVNGAQLG